MAKTPEALPDIHCSLCGRSDKHMAATHCWECNRQAAQWPFAPQRFFCSGCVAIYDDQEYRCLVHHPNFSQEHYVRAERQLDGTFVALEDSRPADQ